MEQVKTDVHIVRENYCTIVVVREATNCRRCKKIIPVNELAMRQMTQARQKQTRPAYYHLNGRCRPINMYIRSDLNVDGTLP